MSLVTGQRASEDTLALPVVSYQELQGRSAETKTVLMEALQTIGAVAISNVPGYPEARDSFFDEAIAFSRLTTGQKDEVASGGVDSTYSYLGYDVAQEQFEGEDRKMYVDSSKRSYYATYPDTDHNKWPKQTNLSTAYLKLAETIHDVGADLMRAVDLLGEENPIQSLVGAHDVGRMLHYTECEQGDPNPNWCGAHTDHGLITGLVSGLFMQGAQVVDAPPGSGLHIKVAGVYRKVTTAKTNIIYQVGEVGQIMTGDKIVATEHLVRKPNPIIPGLERHTFALFFDPPLDTPLGDKDSTLKQDPRYREDMTFNDWHLASLARHKSS